MIADPDGPHVPRVTGQIIEANPAAAVRATKHVVKDGNGDAVSIDGGHRSLVSTYPPKEQREKHPAGRCTMS